MNVKKRCFLAFIRLTRGKTRAYMRVCDFMKMMRMAKNVCKMNFRQFGAFWIFARARARICVCATFWKWWEWPKTYAKWISDNLEHFEFSRAHARVSACAQLFDNDENGLECMQNEFQTIWSILNFCAQTYAYARVWMKTIGNCKK